ncbi:MAG: Antidote-toxin recognition MazE, bacterial antitoxin [Candidatus Parcubacteria bacterium]|jgi:AbrB family looped-hinge helix DNA binding protein
MNTIKLQQRGILTLPKKLRTSLGLTEGQVLRIEEKNGQIIIEPQSNELDRELAKSIKQGIDDIKAGKFIEFSSVSEFHKKLTKYEN